MRDTVVVSPFLGIRDQGLGIGDWDLVEPIGSQLATKLVNPVPSPQFPIPSPPILP
jgi:hypothetical protein